MKNRFSNRLIIGAFVCTTLTFGCTQEDARGPLEIENGVAPAPVEEITFENLPGGALIEYKIPSDEDFLLVEATYKRNTKTVVTKSSAFNNSILVEGLRGVENLDVELVSVDRSNNRSAPVKVTVNPLKAPIDYIFDNITLESTFGGVRAGYNNDDLLKFELLLLTKNENGAFDYRGSAFIENNKRTGFSFRGYEAEPQTFGLVAIDRWDNATDTLVIDLTPEVEQELDFEQFDRIKPGLATDEADAFGWGIGNMWNGSTGGAGFHTSQGSPGQIVHPYEDPHHIISFDLGVAANLSRLKFWQRQGSWIFAHGNPRYFEVWGIEELPDHSGDTLEGWTKLVENGEVIKPSGGPLGSNSAEDVAQAQLGEEFEVLDPTAKIRYIRFVNFQSWSGGKFMHIMEVKFWGKILEE